ncbi:helix-turn-helix transcriptional regulator [Rubrivirga marina]|uniref:HTH luxR-type domain-containing protein n=1 Tax=Rubrivirga marina TaxID=1196024 RepID=A0A271IXM1_9BACT|nr:helix-turn-helix transcriptional regulator [Rubrivirga marina]PAP75688.1 hypothetical protein BSZ37_04175 [Rubrivirga marina]
MILSVTPSTHDPLRVRVDAADPLVRAALPALLVAAGADVVPDAAEADVVLLANAAGAPDDDLPTVALVADGDAARAAWLAGARGLLPRDADGDALLAALGAVAQGLLVVDPAFEDALGAPTGAVPDGVEPLTDREREVLALLAEGLPNKLVADRLGITERTARYHVAQILAKLGAQSRTEAVVTGARLGLVAL